LPRMRNLLVAFLVLAFSAVVVSSAEATQYYASPSGSGDCSTPAQACQITTATTSASISDEVIVAPGTYVLGSSINIGGSDVHGTAGQAKPLIQSSASPGFQLVGTDSKLSDIRIEHTAASTAAAIFAGGNSVVSRVVATSQGTGCSLADYAVIRDSVCRGGSDTFDSGVAYYVGSSGFGQARNITAVGDVGVLVGTSTAMTSATLNMRNVIARGAGTDITTLNAWPSGSSTVIADSSNYDSVVPGAGGTTSVTPVGSGTNQTAAPVFVNAAGGDYRQAPGSPTVDAGTTDSLTSSLDVDSSPRPQGAAIDIGAYELTPSSPPAADTTPPETKIDKGPKGKTKSKKATFVFSSNEAGSTFTCALDRKAAKPCTSPLKLKRLKKGKHVLTVTATDAAGNADATPASYRWKVKRKPKR
jgi:hypothetical protein